MKKTKIIREIVGKRLESYGFRYEKTESATRFFIRELHGIQRYYDPECDVVKQYIEIQDSNYAFGLTVELNTDAHVEGKTDRMEQLKELDPEGISEWVAYEDEESFRTALNNITDIIIKYGLNELERMSREEPILVTKAMEEKLAEQYKELDKAFVEEYHIKTVPEKEEDIDEWYRIIRKVIMESSESPYDEVKEILVKIAAFLGERTSELLSGTWDFVKGTWIHTSYPNPQYSPLSFVFYLWKYKCENQYPDEEDIVMLALKSAVKQKDND